jgi:hypothetical protein
VHGVNSHWYGDEQNGQLINVVPQCIQLDANAVTWAAQKISRQGRSAPRPGYTLAPQKERSGKQWPANAHGRDKQEERET